MRRVVLPDGTATTQLGFGCAGLLGGSGLDHSRSLIHAALDGGIRHFDVAPIYGSGLAEDALGAALMGFAEPVTITTKVGLARPAAPVASSRARVLAKTVLGAMPGLKQKLGRAVYGMTRRKAFSVAEVAASFEESLRRLRRERIDVLLLHEPDPEDLTEELLGWLGCIRAEDRAGSIGFGVSRDKVKEIINVWPGAQFVQTAWAFGDPAIHAGRRFVSTHGAIRAIGKIRTESEVDMDLRGRLRRELGVDPNKPDSLAEGLLGAAIANNANGLTLVATSRADRIRELASRQ